MATDSLGHSPHQITRLITRLNIGGPARQALSLTEKLRAHGFETDLVAGSPGNREGEIPPHDAVEPIRVPHLQRGLDPRSDIRALRSIKHLLDQRPPVIVHTHMAKAGTLGRMAAFRAHVPIVVHTFHGHVLKEYFSSATSRLFLTAEQRLARRSDALIAVSTSVRDELLELGIGNEAQWHVVPLGLELDHLLGPLPDKASSRKSLGISVDRPVVGIVGRLAPIKDHQTFIDACVKVMHEFPSAEFVIAGDGELRVELEEKAAVLGTKVKFLGWVTDLPRLYAALDIVTLTSRNEGTPVALIEAGAASKPVVATRVGGVADVVLDKRSGFLEDVGDSAAIAHSILTLLNNRELCHTMGATGRSHVKDRYSCQRLVTDIAELYVRLLDEKGVGPS